MRIFPKEILCSTIEKNIIGTTFGSISVIVILIVDVQQFQQCLLITHFNCYLTCAVFCNEHLNCFKINKKYLNTVWHVITERKVVYVCRVCAYFKGKTMQFMVCLMLLKHVEMRRKASIVNSKVSFHLIDIIRKRKTPIYCNEF